MKNKIGKVCMILGEILLFLAMLFFAGNQWENMQAGKTSKEWLQKVIYHIEEAETESEIFPDPYSDSMPVEEIDGYSWIGYLELPVLGITLPVMAEWNYEHLKVSACRYYGMVKTDNLVIAAHNYQQHFGRLSELNPGDQIIFTDMNQEKSVYRVDSVEILAADSVEEMISGEYSLNLFTCTYDGKQRVTVHCERIVTAASGSF